MTQPHDPLASPTTGALEGVSAAFGFHVMPHISSGKALRHAVACLECSETDLPIHLDIGMSSMVATASWRCRSRGQQSRCNHGRSACGGGHRDRQGRPCGHAPHHPRPCGGRCASTRRQRAPLRAHTPSVACDVYSNFTFHVDAGKAHVLLSGSLSGTLITCSLGGGDGPAVACVPGDGSSRQLCHQPHPGQHATTVDLCSSDQKVLCATHNNMFSQDSVSSAAQTMVSFKRYPSLVGLIFECRSLRATSSTSSQIVWCSGESVHDLCWLAGANASASQ